MVLQERRGEEKSSRGERGRVEREDKGVELGIEAISEEGGKLMIFELKS